MKTETITRVKEFVNKLNEDEYTLKKIKATENDQPLVFKNRTYHVIIKGNKMDILDDLTLSWHQAESTIGKNSDNGHLIIQWKLL